MKAEITLLPCTPVPYTPLVPSSVETEIGNTLLVNVDNEQRITNMAYYWISPNGTILSSDIQGQLQLMVTANTVAGIYKIVQSNASGTCHSDTAQVNITIKQDIPNCNTANNTIRLLNNNRNLNNGVGSQQWESYDVSWNGDLSCRAQFAVKPNSNIETAYTISSENVSYLEDNQVNFSISTTTGSYNAISGKIYVQPFSGGGMQVIFCNITVQQNVNGSILTSTGVNGNLFYY